MCLTKWFIVTVDIFKCVSLSETFNLMTAPKDQIGNESESVYILAWHRTGAKSLLEPMAYQYTYDKSQTFVVKWNIAIDIQ